MLKTQFSMPSKFSKTTSYKLNKSSWIKKCKAIPNHSILKEIQLLYLNLQVMWYSMDLLKLQESLIFNHKLKHYKEVKYWALHEMIVELKIQEICQFKKSEWLQLKLTMTKKGCILILLTKIKVKYSLRWKEIQQEIIQVPKSNIPKSHKEVPLIMGKMFKECLKMKNHLKI